MEGKERSVRRGVVASGLEKSVGVLTFLSYMSIGFYLSRHRVQLLDDLTDFLLKPSKDQQQDLLQSNGGIVMFGGVISTLHMTVALGFQQVGDLGSAAITYLIENYSHFQLATVGSILIHQVVYWSLATPDFCFQFFPFLRKYKIQPDRHCSPALQWQCVKDVLLGQWLVQAPLIIGNYYFCEFMGYGWDVASLPRWYQIVGAMIGCLAIEDTWHFFMHWLIHVVPTAYQRVHKQHHQFSAPMGMEAEYAHPLEVGILGLGFILGATMFCTHFFMTWLWMTVRLLETIEVHSGYTIPLYGSPLRFLPFYGGVKFHDFHHSNFVGNYGSTFTYWDALFETDVHFRKNLLLNQHRRDVALRVKNNSH